MSHTQILQHQLLDPKDGLIVVDIRISDENQNFAYKPDRRKQERRQKLKALMNTFVIQVILLYAFNCLVDVLIYVCLSDAKYARRGMLFTR